MNQLLSSLPLAEATEKEEGIPCYNDLFAEDFLLGELDDESCKYVESESVLEHKHPTGEALETPNVAIVGSLCYNVTSRAHLVLSSSSSSAAIQMTQQQPPPSKAGKKRGSYNCGKCGQPKKGHVCLQTTPPPTPIKTDSGPCYYAQTQVGNIHLHARHSCKSTPLNVENIPQENAVDCSGPINSGRRRYVNRAKRSLSMDQGANANANASKRLKTRHLRGSRSGSPSSSFSSSPSNDGHGADFALSKDMDSVDSMHLQEESESSLQQPAFLVEVFKRLPPSCLLVASMVCRQWCNYASKVLSGITETQLLVTHDEKRYIPLMLQRCPNLVHLAMDVRSEIDDYYLKSIAYSSHSLASLEIQVSHGGINMVTGDGLNHLVAECKSLCSLKLESCKSIRTLDVCSNHLTTLWMADCYSIKAMVLNCPSLTELSLDFAPEDDGSTDLCNVLVSLSHTCPRLSRLHVASVNLNNSVVLAIANANLRFLCMLSLTFGSGITDASVAALASSFNNLQLLDLSGSNITDRGLGILCNAFSGTLTKLLIALCHQISIAGIQMLTTQLPLLELLDCGMTLDPIYSWYSKGNEAGISQQQEKCMAQPQQNLESKERIISNRLTIKHMRLQTLSLWGCSGIHALYVDCPELVELNLSSCSSLTPENIYLQCPALEEVHAAHCKEVLPFVNPSKGNSSLENVTLPSSTKRMADSSKRVQAPQFGIMQDEDEVEEVLTHPVCRH